MFLVFFFYKFYLFLFCFENSIFFIVGRDGEVYRLSVDVKCYKWVIKCKFLWYYIREVFYFKGFGRNLIGYIVFVEFWSLRCLVWSCGEDVEKWI